MRRGARLARQHIDGCAAVKKIQHHLFGDFDRKGADALQRHAVVRGHDDHRFFGNRRHRIGLHARQLKRNLLQPAEASGGFGQAVLPGLCLFRGLFVNRGNGRIMHSLSFFNVLAPDGT